MTSTATRTSKRIRFRFRLAKQQLCLCSTPFGTFLCRNCTTTTWNCLNSRFSFHVFSSTNEDEFLFHCLNVDIFFKNSTPGWFAYIYKQSEPVQIIALKFQRTRSPFLLVTFSPPLPSCYLNFLMIQRELTSRVCMCSWHVLRRVSAWWKKKQVLKLFVCWARSSKRQRSMYIN